MYKLFEKLLCLIGKHDSIEYEVYPDLNLESGRKLMSRACCRCKTELSAFYWKEK
jgi:hypothetical protein